MVKKLKILKDEDYERGKIPMTKFPIRAETFFRLAISEGERFLDIGVGTGSIAVQAALLGAEVTGIDQSSEAVELTHKNAEKHGVSLHLICGKAPADLPDMLFDKIFIGGAWKLFCVSFVTAVLSILKRDSGKLQHFQNMTSGKGKIQFTLYRHGGVHDLFCWSRSGCTRFNHAAGQSFVGKSRYGNLCGFIGFSRAVAMV